MSKTVPSGRFERLYVSTSAKTLIGVVAVAFVLFVMASAGFYLRDREQNGIRVERELRSTGDAVAEQLSGWLSGRVLLVRFASDTISQTQGWTARERMIRNDTVNRSFEEVYFGNQADGTLVRSRASIVLPRGYDARRRSWYRGAAERRGAILTEPYLSAGKRGTVVTIAVPLFQHGALVGVTGSDFRMETVTRILTNHRDRRERSIFLVDRAGTILAHSDNRWIGRPLAQLFPGAAPPVVGTIQSVGTGETAALIGFRPIRGLPTQRQWYVAVAIDRDVAAAPLTAAFHRSAVTTGVIVAAMLAGFLLILAVVVRRPLKAITGSIGEIAAGRFDAAIPFTGRADEIGDMARAVAIFRDNGREVERLREQEGVSAQREAADRVAMMAQLQAAFGEVVDAASQGDLERRVPVTFADRELNTLASSVNLLIGTIGRGLNEACAVLSAIARTDLTHRVEGDYAGAFAAIKLDSNAVADRLSEIVHQLQDTARHLRRGTADLTVGARRLADRATEQAAAVRGTTDEVQVIAEIIARHAGDAEAASAQARAATTAGREGGRVMRAASAAMKRMTEASERVVSVADVLDGIAQQTSLVALNAAIEAQRAGAAGQTFAVVADEVRRLAHHATSASQEVKATIGAAVEEVAGGARMVAMVEVELLAMLQALGTNSTLLDDIARASQRQARSIHMIEQSVARFDSAVHDNAGLAKELEAITRHAETRAAELDGIVDVFTLERPAGPRAIAA